MLGEELKLLIICSNLLFNNQMQGSIRFRS